MRHWQNLTKDDSNGWRKFPWHGRAWWNRLSVEWLVGKFDLRFSFGHGEGSYKFSFAVPFLLTLYLSFARKGGFKNRREFDFHTHEGAFWLTVWGDDMGYDSRAPWYAKCQRFSPIDFLLGRRVHQLEYIGDEVPIIIPLPEGCYRGKARFERRTWKRPRSPFKLVREATEVTMEKGLPFEGKGENSWDCGEDGIWGYGAEGHNIERAIAKGVELTLKERRRYGTPTRIREAIAAQTA